MSPRRTWTSPWRRAAKVPSPTSEMSPHSPVVPSTLPSLLSISHQETAPRHLHERFARPSSLISISVLFVPLPSYLWDSQVSVWAERLRRSGQRSFSLSSRRHHFTIKVFKTVYCNILERFYFNIWFFFFFAHWFDVQFYCCVFVCPSPHGFLCFLDHHSHRKLCSETIFTLY